MQAAFIKESAILLAGAGVAAVLGVMLGGTMQPQLIFDRQPPGAQMSVTGGGLRSANSFDQGGSDAARAAGAPSYVIGTDHAQTAYSEGEPEAPSIAEDAAAAAEMADHEPEPPAPVALARAHHDEPPLPEVAYPSLGGGQSYDAETPEPPPPPEEEPLSDGG